MVPRIDPVYYCARVVWFTCFPVSWVGAAFTAIGLRLDEMRSARMMRQQLRQLVDEP